MTTREALRRLLDQLTDAEVEALADIAREHGLAPGFTVGECMNSPEFIDARKHPVLAAIWDNDDDRVFDDM